MTLSIEGAKNLDNRPSSFNRKEDDSSEKCFRAFIEANLAGDLTQSEIYISLLVSQSFPPPRSWGNLLEGLNSSASLVTNLLDFYNFSGKTPNSCNSQAHITRSFDKIKIDVINKCFPDEKEILGLIAKEMRLASLSDCKEEIEELNKISRVAERTLFLQEEVEYVKECLRIRISNIRKLISLYFDEKKDSFSGKILSDPNYYVQWKEQEKQAMNVLRSYPGFTSQDPGIISAVDRIFNDILLYQKSKLENAAAK